MTARILSLCIVLVVTYGTNASLVVERRDGTTPDMITHTSESCTSPLNCSGYRALPVNEDPCQCQCLNARNTFSVQNNKCIDKVTGCSDLVFNTLDKLFSFIVLDNELYPLLPVTHLTSNKTGELNCDTENLQAKYETEDGWELLPFRTIVLETETDTNNMYLLIAEDSLMDGKLLQVTYQCQGKDSKDNISTDFCLAFKLQGYQTVSRTDAQEYSSSTSSEAPLKKLDVIVFYWVAGGCIGVLVLAAALGLGIACACRSIGKRREKKMRVLRLEGDASNISDRNHPARQISRISTNPNGAVRSNGSSGPPHRPIFKKNPHRRNHQGGQPGPISPRNANSRYVQDWSPSRARTPRPASQNSATFVVNEDEPRMTHQSPTETVPNIKGSMSSKDCSKENEAIAAAKSALSKFEGERLPSVRKQNGLFNPQYQRLSGMHASIRGMKEDSLMSHATQPENKAESKKKRKHKGKISSSKLSIDYKHFDIAGETSPISSGIGSEESDTTPTAHQHADVSKQNRRKEEIGDHCELSVSSKSESLCEYDIDDSVVIPADKFQRESSHDDANNNLNNSFSKHSAVKVDIDSAESLTSSGSDVETLQDHPPQHLNQSRRNPKATQELPGHSNGGYNQVTFHSQLSSTKSPDEDGIYSSIDITHDDAPVTNIDDLIDMTDVVELAIPADYHIYSSSSSFQEQDESYEGTFYHMYTDTPL